MLKPDCIDADARTGASRAASTTTVCTTGTSARLSAPTANAATGAKHARVHRGDGTEQHHRLRAEHDDGGAPAVHAVGEAAAQERPGRHAETQEARASPGPRRATSR